MHRYLAVIVCLGCVAAPLTQSTANAAVGCYSLMIGQWSQPVAGWRLPEVIRLDSTTSNKYPAEAREWLVLRPDAPTLSRARGGGGSTWQPVGADSIRLIWSGDYEILDARLELRNGQLQGWVHGSTDVIRPTELLPHATLSGRRVRCPTGL
jgi:hypothetical protein